MHNRLPTFLASALLAALAYIPRASADIWIEVGDAGPLPLTAQVTTGPDPLTQIRGTITGFNDADMYQIRIVNPAAFTVVTSAGGSVGDPQLSLFDLNGMGIVHNDDFDSGVDMRARLNGPLVTSLAPGHYYLAITGWDIDPASPGGRIFRNGAPFDEQIIGPMGNGGGEPINGYTGSGSNSGTYTINLTGAGFAIVPEPSTLTLLTLGGLGLLGYRWQQRRRQDQDETRAGTQGDEASGQ
jgi:hypothetical protein